jgi:hypothetical protein
MGTADMPSNITRTPYLMAVLLLAIAGVWIAARTMGAGATAEPPALQSIDREELARGGIQLREPSAAELQGAKVLREAAEALALYQFGGGRILEAKVLVATDTFADNGITCLCWVISSDPDVDPYIHQPIPVEGEGQIRIVPTKSFRLDFVDARSGEWLYGAEHSDIRQELIESNP